MFAILLRGKKISFEHPIKRSFKNAGRLGFDRISDVTAASQLTMCWCETYWQCIRDEMISVRSCLVLVSLLAELASSNDARYEALLITNTVPIYPAFKRKYSTRTPSLIWWREKKSRGVFILFFFFLFNYWKNSEGALELFSQTCFSCLAWLLLGLCSTWAFLCNQSEVVDIQAQAVFY